MFLSFSKKFLNFDFLSKIPVFIIIEISVIFNEINSSINFSIFSETFEIIKSFLFSKKDLFKISDIKLS